MMLTRSHRPSRYACCLLAALTGAGAFGAIAACGSVPDDCHQTLTCASTASATSSSSTQTSTGPGGGGSSGSSASSSSGGGGSSSTAMVNCDPTMGAVDGSCGIFVSSSMGHDADAGTKSQPVATLAHAIQIASGSAIYACGEAFAEAITLPAGSTLYGALDCGHGWAYAAATPTHLTGAPDTIPARFAAGGGSTQVFDVSIVAQDATVDGGSSIAALAEGGSVRLTRVALSAGAGKAGVLGATPTDNVGSSDPNDASVKGANGVAACTNGTTTNLGGTAMENALCPSAGGGPIGGSGGNGALLSGSSGDAQPSNGQTALGGVGEPNSATPMTCAPAMNGGSFGTTGVAGDPGDGATGVASLGTLDSSGYHGVSGAQAGAGNPGQGGGGGGGAAGKVGCAGASGGGGGVGGCGGSGGLGGQAGGSSIALISLGATLRFQDVTMQSAGAGAGGDGGSGEQGGAGGRAGTGGLGATTANACDGGNGGNGGQGGQGGGDAAVTPSGSRSLAQRRAPPEQPSKWARRARAGTAPTRRTTAMPACRRNPSCSGDEPCFAQSAGPRSRARS